METKKVRKSAGNHKVSIQTCIAKPTVAIPSTKKFQ